MSDQPPGIDETSHDLPPVEEAAERVKEFLRQWGDGRIDESNDPEHAPLYARDLEVLSRQPEHTERAVEQARASERKLQHVEKSVNDMLAKQLEQAETAIERVRELHHPTESHLGRLVCAECSNQKDGLWMFHPCETIRALDGSEAP